MDLLSHPHYLANISNFFLLVNSKKVIFEINDNFLKQTYRNRTYIYGANGKLLLSIPVIHSQKNRKKFKDVKILYDQDWPSQHWKSLEISYSNEIKINKYTQVFESKHGFINNLSVLDLIFNEGPNAINFIKTS